jgi:hypothetical protein
VDRDRVEHSLDGGAADFADGDGIVTHALQDLERMTVLAAVFVDWQKRAFPSVDSSIKHIGRVTGR